MERDILLLSVLFSTFLNFNSHAHVERDADTSLKRVKYCYFNSHAHVERDFINFVTQLTFEISTHTLTWSVTY